MSMLSKMTSQTCFSNLKSIVCFNCHAQLEQIGRTHIGLLFFHCCFWSDVFVSTSGCAASTLCVPAGWTSPTRLHRLPHCLLADAPHSDMCVPAHLFGPHYCQACVNKYPGVERSSVPVLHHRGAQSAGRPLLSCSRADRNHDYTVSTVVIHLLPKLRHCTPSYTAAPGHTHIHCSWTCTHIQTGTHTYWQTNTYRYLLFRSHYFPLQCSHGCAGNMDDTLPFALSEHPCSNVWWRLL